MNKILKRKRLHGWSLELEVKKEISLGLDPATIKINQYPCEMSVSDNLSFRLNWKDRGSVFIRAITS